MVPDASSLSVQHNNYYKDWSGFSLLSNLVKKRDGYHVE